MLCFVELAYSSPAAFNPPVRVDSLLQLHCSSDIMTCKPISTGMSKYMFEASGAVAFRRGARSMLHLRTWALYYKAQCCTCCFSFFLFFFFFKPVCLSYRRRLLSLTCKAHMCLTSKPNWLVGVVISLNFYLRLVFRRSFENCFVADKQIIVCALNDKLCAY